MTRAPVSFLKISQDPFRKSTKGGCPGTDLWPSLIRCQDSTITVKTGDKEISIQIGKAPFRVTDFQCT